MGVAWAFCKYGSAKKVELCGFLFFLIAVAGGDCNNVRVLQVAEFVTVWSWRWREELGGNEKSVGSKGEIDILFAGGKALRRDLNTACGDGSAEVREKAATFGCVIETAGANCKLRKNAGMWRESTR